MPISNHCYLPQSALQKMFSSKSFPVDSCIERTLLKNSSLTVENTPGNRNLEAAQKFVCLIVLSLSQFFCLILLNRSSLCSSSYPICKRISSKMQYTEFIFTIFQFYNLVAIFIFIFFQRINEIE